MDGAPPTIPAVTLAATGIDLHSGDTLKAHPTYDEANLTMTLADAATLAGWSHSWPIDIPAAVGGNTGFVGFTASTEAGTAVQDVLTWTCLPGDP